MGVAWTSWGCGGATSGAEADVFTDGDAEQIDPLLLSAWPFLHQHLFKHHARVSDVHGCLFLELGAKAVPRMPLLDLGRPTLCLLQELRRLGWMGVLQDVEHRHADASTVMSIRQVTSRKYYYQCLLQKAALFSSGLERLPSNQPQSFYKCLLDGKIVQPGLGAQAYEAVLRGGDIPAHEGDHDALNKLQSVSLIVSLSDFHITRNNVNIPEVFL